MLPIPGNQTANPGPSSPFHRGWTWCGRLLSTLRSCTKLITPFFKYMKPSYHHIRWLPYLKALLWPRFYLVIPTLKYPFFPIISPSLTTSFSFYQITPLHSLLQFSVKVTSSDSFKRIEGRKVGGGQEVPQKFLEHVCMRRMAAA